MPFSVVCVWQVWLGATHAAVAGELASQDPIGRPALLPSAGATVPGGQFMNRSNLACFHILLTGNRSGAVQQLTRSLVGADLVLTSSLCKASAQHKASSLVSACVVHCPVSESIKPVRWNSHQHHLFRITSIMATVAALGNFRDLQ
jgi:hypothetical protein